MKILDEKIPKSYDDLRQRIAEMALLNDAVVMDRDTFRLVTSAYDPTPAGLTTQLMLPLLMTIQRKIRVLVMEAIVMYTCTCACTHMCIEYTFIAFGLLFFFLHLSAWVFQVSSPIAKS